MNTLLLEPSDVLFFRDGRPMSGSLAGHGAAWPLPSVTNAALHAALHRAGFAGAGHAHRSARSGRILNNDRENHGRKFGSLITAGPFPVCTNGSAHSWFFPRPADAADSDTVYLPLKAPLGYSSLSKPLLYPVANTKEASKEIPMPWWSAEAWNAYLGTTPNQALHFKKDADLADTEHSYGIAIDPGTGAVEEGKFYSAHSLRLKPGIAMGLLAEAIDKGIGNEDFLHRLFDDEHHIIVGGQQRICSVSLKKPPGSLPLPLGMISGFVEAGKHLVKWVLLSPAIWPEIPAQKKDNSPQNPHPGGWLPNWVDQNGAVLLTIGPGVRKAARKGGQSGGSIKAKLVAAIVGKPIPVNGYALPNEAEPGGGKGGAKSTHLAVPAGSVYYFEADSKDDAEALAAALNWHGAEMQPSTIKNRRSTLMGEKGFGLGVCASWKFHVGNVPGHPPT